MPEFTSDLNSIISKLHSDHWKILSLMSTNETKLREPIKYTIIHTIYQQFSVLKWIDLVWYVMDMLIIYLKSLTLMFSSLVYVLLRKSVASWKKLPTYLVELDFNASSLCSFLESCDYYFYVFGWNKTYCCSTITARHIYSTWYQAGLKW